MHLDVWVFSARKGGHSCCRSAVLFAVAFMLFTSAAFGLAVEGMVARAFLPPNGAPFEETRSIVEAKDGALWFGSWGKGVARLKGAQWREFTRADGMPSDFVRQIAIAPGGSIWVATKSGGAYISPDGIVTSLISPDFPPDASNAMASVSCLRDGRVLFGMEDGRILAYNASPDAPPAQKEAWSVFLEDPVPGSEDDITQALFEAKDGTLWIAQGHYGVSRYRDGAWTHFGPEALKMNCLIRSLVEAPDGTIWAAGSNPPFYFDGTSWHEARHMDGGDDPDATCVALTPRGQILAGTSRDGLRLREGNQWTPISFDLRVGRPLIRTIFFDSRHRGWIGTKEGVLQYGHLSWEDVTHSPGHWVRLNHAFSVSPAHPPIAVNLRNEIVTFRDEQWEVLGSLPFEAGEQDMTDYVDGVVWILMDRTVYEFSVSERRILRTTTIPSPFTPERLLRTSDGQLYAYGYGGVCKLVDGEWQSANPPDASTPFNVGAMAETADGGFLMCHGAGSSADVSLWRNGRMTPLLVQDPNTSDAFLGSAAVSRDGRMWVGTLGKGVWTWGVDGVQQETSIAALQSGRISYIYEASNGAMWFGTQSMGVSCLLRDRCTNFSHLEGLPNEIVLKVGEYPEGTIWIATRHLGVYRYVPDTDPPRTQIVAGPSSIPHRGAGVFSVAGYDAWNATAPESLEFSWRILHASNKEAVTEWSPFSRHATLVTPPLGSGVYALEVRASDVDRNIDPAPVTAEFEVQPPFYFRPGVYLPFLALLGIALLLSSSIYMNKRKLRKSEAEVLRLGRAVEQAAESIIVTTPEGVIEYVNPAFERISGYSRSEVEGKNPRILKSGQHEPGFYRRMWDTLAAGETWTGRIVNKRKDGTLFEEDVSIAPVRGAYGQTLHYVAVKRDITEQVRLEAQLQHAQKMEAIGQLAGGVAHDFNNLLQVIQGYTQLTADDLGETHPETTNLVEVLRACDQARTLTRQLLSFSRREVLQPRNLDLNRAIEDMIKILRRLIGEHIELRLVAEPGLKTVFADAAQMGQVLINLCVNARDAMPEGGIITIATRNRKVDDTLCAAHPGTQPGDYVELSVRDTGAGMPPEVRDRVFEPFFTTKELGRGTGLGLATVYGIVEQHGGFIHIASELEHGSTFSVYLPATDGRHVELPKIPEDHSFPMAGTVLFAEDEEIVRNLGVKVLTGAGYHVLTACNGEEAIAEFQRHMDEIDVAVLDVVMPKLSGRAVCERIQALRPELPVLFSSGYGQNQLDADFLSKPNVACIQKPYSPSDLLQKLREVLAPTTSHS